MAYLLRFVAIAMALLLTLRTNAKSPQARYHRQGECLEDHYVVQFHRNHSLFMHEQATGLDISRLQDFYYLDFYPGYSAVMDKHTLHELVRRDPGVKYVEHETVFKMHETRDSGYNATGANEYINSESLFERYTESKRANSPWNLRMVGAGVKLPYPIGPGDYHFLQNAGYGVRIYIMDAGMLINHVFLKGRAVNFLNRNTSPYTGLPMNSDPTGHGTAVAGIAGATALGVAQAATLVNVPIANARRDLVNSSKLAQAISDITAEHKSLRSQSKTYWRGSVINMSWGGSPQSFSTVFRTAIHQASSQGIAMVASAGNDNADAVSTFPCTYQDVVCVGAVDQEYQRAVNTNYGDKLEVVAPGQDIITPDSSSVTSTKLRTGTSMSTPHVAGILATFIGWEALNSHSSAVHTLISRLRSNQIFGIVSGFPAGTWVPPFATTGIRHQGKDENLPYVGAPPQRVQGNAANANEPPTSSSSLPPVPSWVYTNDPVVTDNALTFSGSSPAAIPTIPLIPDIAGPIISILTAAPTTTTTTSLEIPTMLVPFVFPGLHG